MAAELERLRFLPRDERPYRWTDSRADRDTPWNPAPNEPADHMRRYLAALAAAGHRFIGPTVAAYPIHELACQPTGYRLDLGPAREDDPPAPTGAAASAIAARLTGASYGQPPATLDQRFHRACPRGAPTDRFGVYVARQERRHDPEDEQRVS